MSVEMRQRGGSAGDVGRAGLQAADRQAWRTLWAQVLSSSVTECLSGSCSSLDVMFLWTVCRKLFAPGGERESRGQVESLSLLQPLNQ